MCCVACFADDFLSDFIARNSEMIADCNYCGSREVPRISPERLAPYFEPVLDAYSPRQNGEFLWTLLADDWQLFGATAQSEAILRAVLGEAAGIRYAPRESAVAPSPEIWTSLRTELQSENRFFPQNAPDRALFASLIENLVRPSAAVPARLYRARVMRGATPYELGDMGAPPADLASDGRANPIGIRYLYVADDPHTAIAEVKPSKGALLTAAEFVLVEDRAIRLIDLTSPRKTISPFRINSSLADVLGSMSFLDTLGEELSVPTQPHRATRDYLASQYLCELIKVSGYDGVIYRSSLANGQNIALFDVSVAVPQGALRVYRVTDVNIVSELQDA